MAVSAPKTNPPTASQQRAVVARGNVLVMAGAGTGKTKTLVDRCVHCLEHDGAQIDELLIVTFTEAAAAEMRERLRKQLEGKISENPANDFWPEQLARFDLAHIGTLHSFCLKLVREHFYELGLDPQLAILDEGEARQLANETLDEQFNAHYEGQKDFSKAVLKLIQVHGNGRDEKIRALVLLLHHYSQARPDAAGWLAREREKFAVTEPVEWQQWVLEAIADWQNEWLPVLENLKGENAKAAELAGILSSLKTTSSRESIAEILKAIAAADLTASYPKGKAGKLRPALGKIFEEATFLASLASVKNGIDPLAQDWEWVREEMETLLRLAEEFAENFAAKKRADGVVDFHDLEQFSLKLLWDFSTEKPSAIAEGWRAKLRFIFVDEYQDINAAQDKIIQGLSRDVPAANRFLVGDVKQSIYRFRLADPQIFRDYAHGWHGEKGQTIPLSENFRSREGLLNFVNSLCGQIMRAEIGGVEYDREAALKFGAAETRKEFSVENDSGPRVELLVRLKNGRGENHDADDSELAGLGDTEREARVTTQRLKKFVSDGNQIFDVGTKSFRPAEWRDVAILLRATRGKSEIFAKEFERAGIPPAVARGGFYESAEILDLLSVLQLLDNPLQDVPCIAVLRSPLVGLSLEELAQIRLAAREKHFWTAVVRSQQDEGRMPKDLTAKISSFLEKIFRWRRCVRQISLSQCLEQILAETFYAEWLRAQPRGEQRAANVLNFLQLAQQFDQFQRQGLFRFLKFIEAQQAAEVEPEVSVPAGNAVRLMSIHQSKGLEFPVVVLPDLAKGFNQQDLSADIIFDERFGLCPKIKPPEAGGRYPSLPHWLAQRRQRRELRGEELRLLYVATTRARDNLILLASVSEKSWSERWLGASNITAQKLAAASSYADWLALWFAARREQCGVTADTTGILPELRWEIVEDTPLSGAPVSDAIHLENSGQQEAALEVSAPPDATALEKLRARLEWNYPGQAATQRKAKASVTALRREADELDDEAEAIFSAKPGPGRFSGKFAPNKRVEKMSAADIGKAHHKFLQHVSLEKTGELAAEADRLARENYLSAEERAVLDLRSLEHFWCSELGKKIAKAAANVRRELPFTARFSPSEIATITGAANAAGLENEFVVVQGVADLVIILSEEIWLVDFKTDAVSPRELPEKIRTYTPQLKLYAAALEKIFARRVTRRVLHFLSAGKTVIL